MLARYSMVRCKSKESLMNEQIMSRIQACYRPKDGLQLCRELQEFHQDLTEKIVMPALSLPSIKMREEMRRQELEPTYQDVVAQFLGYLCFIKEQMRRHKHYAVATKINELIKVVLMNDRSRMNLWYQVRTK